MEVCRASVPLLIQFRDSYSASLHECTFRITQAEDTLQHSFLGNEWVHVGTATSIGQKKGTFPSVENSLLSNTLVNLNDDPEEEAATHNIKAYLNSFFAYYKSSLSCHFPTPTPREYVRQSNFSVSDLVQALQKFEGPEFSDSSQNYDLEVSRPPAPIFIESPSRTCTELDDSSPKKLEAPVRPVLSADPEPLPIRPALPPPLPPGGGPSTSAGWPGSGSRPVRAMWAGAGTISAKFNSLSRADSKIDSVSIDLDTKVTDEEKAEKEEDEPVPHTQPIRSLNGKWQSVLDEMVVLLKKDENNEVNRMSVVPGIPRLHT